MPQPSMTHGVPSYRRARAASAAALFCVTLAACAAEAPTEMTVELPLFAASQVGAGRTFDLDMSQELTATVTGDPDGVGTASLTLNAGQGFVCWSISASNILLPATASHIHKAPFGVSGPIMLPLSPPDATGHSSGCTEGVDRDLIVALLSDPSAYYVNVHTAEFPPGAIRSQMR